MPPYRHIVVGLDLNPKTASLTAGSRSALAHARWLAEGTSTRITLLHSGAADEFYLEETNGYEATLVGDPPRESLEAALAEITGAGIQAELELTGERAWLAITQRVLAGPADLVVVGKRTEAHREGPFVGSSAARLLRKCPCAVWAVKPGSAPPPHTLLAATDLSPVGDRVLERAVQLCQRSGATLHVVHSFQFSMAAQLEANQAAYIEQATSQATKSVRGNLTRLGYDREPALHIGLGSPSRAITECVSRFHPDLLVMATISRGGVGGLLLGNTAERMLQRVDTSLLTVKPADFVCPVTLPG